MELKGTVEERVEAAIAFARASRKPYDHEKISDLYRKVGVPYTEAAEKVYREWDGVFEDIVVYHEDSIHCVDFFIYFFKDPKDFMQWYSVDAEKFVNEQTDPIYRTLQRAHSYVYEEIVKEKCAPGTVPIAEGGYYYQGGIYVQPDGKLMCYHPDYDDEDGWHFDDFTKLLDMELGAADPWRIERILEEKEVSGTLEAQVKEEIAYIRSHGGFKSCRLMNSAGIPVHIENDEALSDEEITQMLLQFFQRPMPEMLGNPHRIWHVMA